jgi:hypothetical protein
MASTTVWGDVLAIAIQHYHAEGRVNGNQPLVRIDYQDEAAQAPFQFDPVRGRIHRTECRFIPADARSALFGRWSMHEQEAVLACRYCRPVPSAQGQRGERTDTVEVLYGVISILGQFGTLLQERGKEFRNSDEGKQIQKQVEAFYAGLDAQQQGILDLVMLSLDQMLEAVRECDESLQPAPRVNGHAGRNAREVVNGSRRAAEVSARQFSGKSGLGKSRRRAQEKRLNRKS